MATMAEDDTATAIADEQVEGTFSALPDEVLLSIFQHLDNQDIVFSVAKVCMRWEKLASDPELWSDRFVFYDSIKYSAFTATMHIASKQIKYLHLGGHEAMEEEATQALLSSNITVLKRLSFLGTCRTNPTKVIQILNKFRSNLESLTLCINDELVSFGTDEKTCYAMKDARPGLLFNLIGGMENLRHLTLYGGFSTKWYFDEFLQSAGCNKIETLDLKDFEELSENFRSSRELDVVQTLIMKNKDHLQSLKLPTMGASSSGVQRCVHKCYKSLKNLSINMKLLISYHNESLNLNFLELNGRFLHDRELESVAFLNDISQYGDLLHRLNELNLNQFDIVEEDMFSILSKYLHDLKILRIEGNWLTSENINVITKNLPLLEKICVRNSYTVAEKHMISLHCPVSTLNDIGFDDIYDMDCIYVATKFRTVPLLDYSVISTGCECRKNFLSKKELKSDLDSKAFSPESLTLRMIQLSLSNNLDIKFLSKFWKPGDNDRSFHFEQ
ncbi:uncharacterized protein LOC117639891 [Thrips palmi]|uniref:Uncharacterized protein LOC117639891 n=1 Tax=Thrips palmi TaxID=161013 RepID=A0A6P8Y6V3_THRPL|nr:uncharacterized protein LOC117639891 [Thrips palmi]